MRIFERLPGRAHAAQPQRKRYDDVIATLSRRPIVDAATARAHDQAQEQQQARLLELEQSDA
jgi:hypothetical protein